MTLKHSLAAACFHAGGLHPVARFVACVHADSGGKKVWKFLLRRLGVA